MQTTLSTARMPRTLWLFLACNVLFYAGAFAGTLRAGSKHIMLQQPPSVPHRSFADFYNLAPSFIHIHHTEFFTQALPYPPMYPAPVDAAYGLLLLTGTHALAFFLAFIGLSFIAAAILFGKSLVRRGMAPLASAIFVTVTLVCSYPLHFEWKQANMEIVVWCLLCVALWGVFHRRPYLAAVCIGIAGAMKIFPLVFAALLLSKKQYRAVAACVVTVIVVTLASLWIVYPSIAVSWHGTNAMFAKATTFYMLTFRFEEGYNHSLWGMFKVVSYYAHHKIFPQPEQMAPYLRLYVDLTAAIGTLLYFVRIRFLPMANQVLCLSIASILLPPMSFDYTLVHLYGPWAVFVILAVAAWRSGREVPYLSWIFVLFAFLVSPESELVYHGLLLAGAFKAVALTAMLGLALWVRFPGPYDAPEPARAIA